jgi:hypothetical protein
MDSAALPRRAAADIAPAADTAAAHGIVAPVDGRAARRRFEWLAAVAWASLLAWFIHGYQFGHSNHTVYLLDALRHEDPSALSNDWFTTRTLQYHAAFGVVTRALYRVHALAGGFLVGYVLLVGAMHYAWARIVRALGGDIGAFLLSVTLFYLSAAGTALGMYQFLQDSAFLPSNIAAVAMLCAIWLWLDRRPIAAGACLGVAGLFHLNYALVAPLLWVLLLLLASGARAAWHDRAAWIGSALVLLPCGINIGVALHAKATRSGRMPLAEFVDLYARLRHPHHYDPSSWPWWLWLGFLWPIPLAVLAYVRLARGGGRLTRAWRDAAGAFVLFSALVLLALIGAGVTYVSETLIQASLYRFSIYPKLLSCVGAAMLILAGARRYGRGHLAIASAFCLALLVALICLRRGPYAGLFKLVERVPGYDAACDSVRRLTPRDAVFLVPPNEQTLRLRAGRAIVIDFKGVPQLSGELIEWRDRLAAVLDLPDLRSLPHGDYPAALRAIRDRYDALPPEHLESVARRYGARYVLVDHRLGGEWESRRVDLDGNTLWFLYDLSR